MTRKFEYIKRSEARIMVFLKNSDSWLRCGKKISEKLNIDYIYTMKILGEMYQKGWLLSHRFCFTTYFRLSEKAPIEMAVLILTNPQCKLKTNDNRKIQESDLEAQGNEQGQPLQQ